MESSQKIFERLMEIARASALEEIASGIAHELNQPLGAIATYAQAGERMLGGAQPKIDAAVDVFRQITNQAMGAADGIRRIRKVFSRDAPSREPVSIAALIGELEPLLSMMANRAGTSLSIDASAAKRPVQADPLRIQHVLFTLVQNAIEASAGKPGAAVRVHATFDGYDVEVAVEDRGHGIPEDKRAQVFRPFFTTKPHGIGLGLASSRAIVESHEGKIGFDALAGGGTRFWFKLPVLAGAPALPGAPASA